MIALGYLHEEEARLRLLRLEDQEDLDDGAPVGAILLSRLEFDVRIMEIPRISERHLDGLIRYRLRTVYPGNPVETVFDYRIETSGSRREVVVFVSHQATLEKYRSAAAGKPLLLPYSLIRTVGKTRKDCGVLFCHPEWTELSVFRSGLLVSCALVEREEEAVPESVCQGARDLPIVIISAGKDFSCFADAGSPWKNQRVSRLGYRDLAALHRRPEGVFREGRKSNPFLTQPVRITGLSCGVVVLAALLLFKQAWQAEAAYAEAKETLSRLEMQSRAVLGLQKDVETLSARLAGMQAHRPLDVWLFLSELSRVLGGDARIRSLEVKGDAFRVEALGSNPLRLMETFRGNPFFSDLELSQVVPDARTGKERFSFSGVFRVR